MDKRSSSSPKSNTKLEIKKNDNKKRKTLAKTDIQKRTRNTTKKTQNIKCPKCKKNVIASAKFCDSCGCRMGNDIELNNSKLLYEIKLMQKKNEDLQKLIQLRAFSSNQLWFVMKLMFPLDGVISYPMQSYIIESNPTFNNLLGYEKLENIFYPDLFHRNHIVKLDEKNFFIKVERNAKILNPKLIYEDDVYIRHSRGHYIHMALQGTFYFDSHTKLPSVRMIYIKKILDANVPENELPKNHEVPPKIHFYTDNFNELPDFIKRFCHKPFQNDQIQDQDSIPSNHSLIILNPNQNDPIHQNQKASNPHDFFMDPSFAPNPTLFDDILPTLPSSINQKASSSDLDIHDYSDDLNTDHYINNEDIFNFF